MAERAETKSKPGPAGKERVTKKKAAAPAAARAQERFRIERWMKMPVITVRPRDTVAQARAILEEHRVNQLPVVLSNRLVGIVTDRDLRDAPRAVELSASVSGAHIAGPETSPEQIPVEEVMSPNVLTLSSSDTLQKAAEMMRRERIGAVPIVDRTRLVGIVSRSDVLKAFIELCK